MSLDLDDRQRAMLREMGVHVWLPATPVAVSDVASVPVGYSEAIENIATCAIDSRSTGKNDLKDQTASRPAVLPKALAPVALPVAISVRAAGPTQVTALVEGIAAMDWPQLTQAVTHCQACAMCLGRRAPVLAAPTELTPCDWMVVADPPDEVQERLGQPFVEEAGVLLDNMLRAVGVTRFAPDVAADSAPATRAYLTHVLKCRPALVRAPAATELALCANYLRREIALTQPKVILAMGRFAMQLLLSETPPESAKLPLGKLRGQVWQFAGVQVVVTYPPSYLLRSGQDKGKAWSDLCLALDVARGKLPG